MPHRILGSILFWSSFSLHYPWNQFVQGLSNLSILVYEFFVVVTEPMKLITSVTVLGWGDLTIA